MAKPTIPRPTPEEWNRACAGIIGVEVHYEQIGATEGAMELIHIIAKCLRYGAALTAGHHGHE
jgi:hypothetical protein